MAGADLIVSDGYHRAKRAAQTYGAILVVIGLVSSPSVGWEGLTLPMSLARILLMGACIFYAVIFEIEWRSAARRNSDLFGSSRSDSIDERLIELGQEFEGMINRARNAEQAASNTISTAPAPQLDEERLIRGLRDTVERHVEQPYLKDLRPEIIAQALERMEQGVKAGFQVYINETTQGQEANTKALALLTEQTARMGDELKVLRADFHRLGSRFSGDQRFLFNWLDRRATWVIAVLGVALNLAQLIAGPLIRCTETI